MRPIATWLLLPALLLFQGAPARSAETVLHLSQSTTLAVPPDELLTLMRIEAVAATAAEAQSRVNTLARAAAAAAEPVKEVRFAAIGYQVGRMTTGANERLGQWRASQSFRLASGDGAALLTLVGTLQQMGLAVTAMQWRLTAETERRARQSATRDILKSLTDRSADTAEALGLTFSHFRSIQLDADDPNGPSPRQAMMSRAMEVSGPVAGAEDVVIIATAQAEAVLVTR